MVRIRIELCEISAHSQEGTLYYCVTHQDCTRQICTGYRIFQNEWNSNMSDIIFVSGVGKNRNEYLSAVKACIVNDLRGLEQIIKEMKLSCQPFSVDDIVDKYLSARNSSFISFIRSLIVKLKLMNNLSTSERYSVVFNSFIRFCGYKEISFVDVDSSLMLAYELYLREKGVCPNTSSFYMRNLRAIYNRAVEQGLTIQRYPFRYVYTGIAKTVKRAVSLDVIREILSLELMDKSADFARDIFMFSFYTRGMSFVDIAYAKKNDLQNGILSYYRRKTGKQLFVRWEQPMQDIIDKYDTSDSPYLLPVIRDKDMDDKKQYKNALRLVNKKLKLIGEMIGLNIPLTTYVARHCWATIARNKNISISIISEAMGHNSESTTRIYLDSLDASLVDDANKTIMSLVL